MQAAGCKKGPKREYFVVWKACIKHLQQKLYWKRNYSFGVEEEEGVGGGRFQNKDSLFGKGFQKEELHHEWGKSFIQARTMTKVRWPAAHSP